MIEVWLKFANGSQVRGELRELAEDGHALIQYPAHGSVLINMYDVVDTIGVWDDQPPSI